MKKPSENVDRRGKRKGEVEDITRSGRLWKILSAEAFKKAPYLRNQPPTQALRESKKTRKNP